MIHSDQTTPFCNVPKPGERDHSGAAEAHRDAHAASPICSDTPVRKPWHVEHPAPERLHDPEDHPQEWCPLPRSHPRRWTPERQRIFIETLAETGMVTRAAARAGMSRESAYQLRRRADRADFRKAWDAATDIAGQMLQEVAFDRVLNGSIETRYDAGGEVAGYTRRMNDRLLMFMLTHHRPAVYGSMSGAQRYDAWGLQEARKEQLPALLNGFRRREQRAEPGLPLGDETAKGTPPASRPHDIV